MKKIQNQQNADLLVTFDEFWRHVIWGPDILQVNAMTFISSYTDKFTQFESCNGNLRMRTKQGPLADKIQVGSYAHIHRRIILTEFAICDLVSSTLDMPKSPSLTRPDFVRKIFNVLMSLKTNELNEHTDMGTNQHIKTQSQSMHKAYSIYGQQLRISSQKAESYADRWRIPYSWICATADRIWYVNHRTSCKNEEHPWVNIKMKWTFKGMSHSKCMTHFLNFKLDVFRENASKTAGREIRMQENNSLLQGTNSSVMQFSHAGSHLGMETAPL